MMALKGEALVLMHIEVIMKEVKLDGDHNSVVRIFICLINYIILHYVEQFYQ